VEKDDLQAFMWIDRSANLGDDKAKRARETMQKALPREIFIQ
jgi:TPR repeat protein